MAVLKLQLLGGFKALTDSGQEIDIRAKKGRGLLAILALSPHDGIGRERLATLLWGDRGEDQARNSLRQTLNVLRKDLALAGPNLLISDDGHVRLTDQAIEVDAVLIAELSLATDAPTLRRALTLIQGELLADISVAGSAFEEWLTAERSRMQSLMTSVFDRLLPLELPGERVALAKRLIALDPLRESSNIALMDAYAEAGERALALKHYSTYKDTLKAELSIRPGPDIEQLRIRLMSAVDSVGMPSQTASPPENYGTRRQEKPSIAVLTFVNLSNDTTQRYFSDGITADIVIELSRFHQFLVRAQHHAVNGERPFVDAVAAGRELGVQFVVEGSVRRLAQRVRINAQLLSVDTGEHLWGERFDAKEDDIFAMQDQIVRSIAAQLSGRLQLASLEKSSRKAPSSTAAYDCVLRGDALSTGVPEAEAEARWFFQKAIELDPDYARAYAHLSSHTSLEWARDIDAPVTMLDHALELAKKAVALDDGDEFCHLALGYAHMSRKSHELAEYHCLKALNLNPNNPRLLASLGIVYGFRGEPERALSYFREALTIDPHFNPAWYWRNRAVAHFIARDYEESISAFKRSPTTAAWSEAYLAAAYAQLGRMQEARTHTEMARRLMPAISIRYFLVKDPYLRNEDIHHLTDALRKAGFDE